VYHARDLESHRNAMTPPEEPVVESAPLALWVAERLCRASADGGQSCAWYHGFWQVLRALDLVTTPAHHAAFFAEAFAASQKSRPRVLISGAIDYSMLAHVLWACGARGAEVVVVDHCDTPLFLNLWYARRAGVAIATVRSDILALRGIPPCDIVCTHSFLGQFAPRARRALIEKWRELLAPGGRVITVNRVRSDAGAAPAAFSPEQARALREAVLHRAAWLEERLAIAPEQLARGLEAYLAQQRPHPVRSAEEIRALFERGGFALERLVCAPVAAAPQAPSGPTTPGGAIYAQIVARRR
jgi:SAM-dependent methyltransferase